jgi:hypothetical protein
MARTLNPSAVVPSPSAASCAIARPVASSVLAFASMQADYYLVSAARRSHRLKPGRSYVFGREAGVDILLQDALVSRRHAEVRWRTDDGWDLVDLGSRNGVSVNGMRVKESAALQDGDQVAIGGQVFRYHLLPPGGDPASLSNQAPQISNVETIGPGFNLGDLAGQGAAFTGALSDGLLVVLQFLLQTHKSGRLDLIGAETASIWVENGVAVHAKAGAATGIDAMVALNIAPPPRFAFHAGIAPDEKTIEGSGNGVLMEVARMSDEKKR